METAHIYFLPGLGTDERIFERLALNAPTTYIPFLEPLKDENIKGYALRLSEKIQEKENVVLIGMSFGGLLAQEIAAIRPIQKIVLISTVKKRSEMAGWMKAGRFLPLHKIPIPVSIRSKTVRFWGKFFGAKHATAVLMFRDMLEQYSDWYYRWSSNEIVRWKGVQQPSPILHIHGDNDLLFPRHKIDDCIEIPNATHAMVYTHADEISRIINKNIAQ